MGPPVTRSQSTESRAVVALKPRPDSDLPASANLAGALADLDDRATVRGRDAKALRDATVLAIGEVRDEARAGATRLAQTINEGNSSLLSDLNNSFAAVERNVAVSNCYLIPTVVHMRHGATSPDSLVGNLAQCTYESDCGARLIVSDQGYAVAPVIRRPR
ncbi:hypothetical protein V3C99_015519 [Haemonchus contortus]